MEDGWLGLTTPLPGETKDWLQALRRRAIEARRGMIVSHRVSHKPTQWPECDIVWYTLW